MLSDFDRSQVVFFRCNSPLLGLEGPKLCFLLAIEDLKLLVLVPRNERKLVERLPSKDPRDSVSLKLLNAAEGSNNKLDVPACMGHRTGGSGHRAQGSAIWSRSEDDTCRAGQ